ncbi:MAG: hypothetical protein ACK4S4_08805 [Pyrinomonadaceae bacterium]
MYKNASKAWQRLRAKAGNFGPKKLAKLSSIRKEARRAARAFLKTENTECSFCGEKFTKKAYADHLYSEHERAICKFCKTPIPRDSLHQHIKNAHGQLKYSEWAKGKAISKKKDTDRVVSKLSKLRKSPSQILEKCPRCSLMVDVKAMDIHGKRYCTAKSKPPRIRK